jgi:glycerol uptake facilitator-like aquaporin
VEHELLRRTSAEAVGTALLAAAVVGSGIAAQDLSPGSVGLQLLENSIATGAALVALILALGPLSGAHFNPIVTLADRTLGGITTGAAACYIGAQLAGACAGVATANVMFSLSAVDISSHVRSGGGIWLGEAVATFGLVLVILGVVRNGHGAVVAFAVGGYIAAAYWFTSSTSFANPALTVGRALTDTFAGIAPSSVPMFVVMQVVGALAAVGLARYWHPTLRDADLIVPGEQV